MNNKYECWADIIRAYKSNELSIEQFFIELEKYEDKMNKAHVQFEYFRAQLQEYIDSDNKQLSEAAWELADAIEEEIYNSVPSPAEIEEEKKKITGDGYIIIGKYRFEIEY